MYVKTESVTLQKDKKEERKKNRTSSDGDNKFVPLRLRQHITTSIIIESP